MACEVLMPKLGFTMQTGNLVEWLAANGASVQEGQPLFAIEAEKSAQEIEAPATGKLKIVVKPGEDIEIGTILAYIE